MNRITNSLFFFSLLHISSEILSDCQCVFARPIFIFAIIRITISKSWAKWWKIGVFAAFFFICIMRYAMKTNRREQPTSSLCVHLLNSIWKIWKRETSATKSVHARNRALTAFILMRQQHSNGQIKLFRFWTYTSIHTYMRYIYYYYFLFLLLFSLHTHYTFYCCLMRSFAP